MKILRDSEIPIDQWNELIQSSTISSPFQTKLFYDIVNDVSIYKAHAIAVEDHNDLQALVLITFQKEPGLTGFLSRRGIIFGGPLLSPINQIANTLLLNEIFNLFRKKAIYFETRNAFNYDFSKETFRLDGWKYTSNLNVKLNLQNKEIGEILSNMKYNRRREIRISKETGASFRNCKNDSELTELYKILQYLYLNKVKLPLPPIEFFKGIMNSSVGNIFVVEHNTNIIGGSVCLFLPNREIYTMYYCGERNYNKKIYPTHLSILAAIEFGLSQRVKSLDFMGAGTIDKEYGVRQYKLEFGGELVEHGRFLKISQSLLYLIGTNGLKLYKSIR